MTDHDRIPWVLIVDDLFGRSIRGQRNPDRARLCAQYLLDDRTGDQPAGSPPPQVPMPVARAVFTRGQTPQIAASGETVVNAPKEVVETVRTGWPQPGRDGRQWSMVLLDLHFKTGKVQDHPSDPGMPEGLPGDDAPGGYYGMELLKLLRKEFPNLPVALFSGKPRGEVELDFANEGAAGFLERDRAGAEGLRQLLRRHGLIQDPSGILAGRAPSFLTALLEARQAAVGGAGNILLCGAPGTGKELFARYIHAVSPKSQGPFQVLFPAGTSESMFEDQVFGHAAGSFTGAKTEKAGLAELANHGTLFIDECAEITSAMQGKFLRLLDPNTRESQRIGDVNAQRLDIQIVLATSRDLPARGFPAYIRDDIRRRITAVIHLPKLRQRSADIPLLAERFVRRAETRIPGAKPRVITKEASDRLEKAPWPGNVAELEETINRSVERYPDVGYLTPAHLQFQNDPAPAESRPMTEIPELLACLGGFEFDFEFATKWSGRFPEVQSACARLLIRHLQAALHVTRTVVHGAPAGSPRYHPAVKLLLGDDTLTASQAADLIKRLMKFDSAASESALVADPLLAEAYRKATELRLSRPKKPSS